MGKFKIGQRVTHKGIAKIEEGNIIAILSSTVAYIKVDNRKKEEVYIRDLIAVTNE